MLEQQARGRRRLPGAAGVPGLGLLDAARREGRRARGEQPARAAAARLRRARRDDRAARHRRRPRRTRTCAAASSRGSTWSAAMPTRSAAPDPDGSNRLERHGTEMAGILVGAGGPGGVDGIAPGRLGAADPRRGLAARRHGRLRRLRAHRPADRRARARGRPEPRRRRPRRRADRADRRGGLVRGLRRLAGGARDRRARCELDTLVVAPAGNDGPAGPGLRQRLEPGRRAGRADGRRRPTCAPTPRRCRSRCASGLDLAARPPRCRWPAPSSPRRPIERELAAPRAGGSSAARVLRRPGRQPRRRPRRARRRRRRPAAGDRVRGPGGRRAPSSSTGRSCRPAGSASTRRSTSRS